MYNIYMKNLETITAIGTPLGVGGISIIRISGANAKSIANKIFNCKISVLEFEPRKLYLGKIKTEEFTEQCLCVFFRAPYSYTGEDIIEFQIHGGVLITNKILDLIIANGAKLAEPGEFTKRAFINGKISLDKAEGIIDTINASSEMELKSASNLTTGIIGNKINSMQDIITNLIAQVEVAIDYPEHDIEYITEEKIKIELNKVYIELDKLIESSIQGKIIKDGINVALVGAPNVGKSSIMNALLEYNRAIVSNVAGTTRDTLTESFIYKGIRVNLIDTAGIHESNDFVENLGIERSWQTIKNADVVLYIIDCTLGVSNEDKEILNKINPNKTVIVNNKIDIQENINTKIDEYKSINTSATENIGLELLKEEIYNKALATPLNNNSIYITNARHKELLNKAKQSIQNCINAVDSGLSIDLIAMDLQDAWRNLGEITGKNYNNEVLNLIFSTFCLGK